MPVRSISATSERRDEGETFDEPTLTQPSPEFCPFLTPPHVSTPRSPLLPPSPSRDTFNTSTPSTQVSPASVSSFSSPSSSPFVLSSFDPVVGGGGGPFKTPTRSRVYTLQRSHVTDAVHASASLPTTPSKPNLTSPFFPSDTWNTWPPHPRLHGRRSNIVGQPSLAEEADSPSKKGKNQSGFDMLTPDNAILDPVRKKGLTTRYVLVEGFDKSSGETSVRNLLHVSPNSFRSPEIWPCTDDPISSAQQSCQDLSLVGNLTSRLRSEGAVVLVFHDIRHSVAAVRRLDSGDHFHGQIPGTAHLSARCITRETFEAVRPALFSLEHCRSPPSSWTDSSHAISATGSFTTSTNPNLFSPSRMGFSSCPVTFRPRRSNRLRVHSRFFRSSAKFVRRRPSRTSSMSSSTLTIVMQRRLSGRCTEPSATESVTAAALNRVSL